jgi:hypothetical protein
MDQKIMTTTVAALALVAAYGPATTASAGLFHTAAAVVAPVTGFDIADQREIIAPRSDIDPDMARMPPTTGARMPVVAPPELPGGRFGIQR